MTPIFKLQSLPIALINQKMKAGLNPTVKSLTNQSIPQKPALAGSGSTGIAITLTFIESGAAGSFLWLLSFAEKESDYHWLK